MVINEIIILRERKILLDLKFKYKKQNSQFTII